jgi:TM2 domain-containing membrane protein YozV
MSATYKVIGANGEVYGPATVDQLKVWLTEGRIAPSTNLIDSHGQVLRAESVLWAEPDHAQAPVQTPISPAPEAASAPTSGSSHPEPEPQQTEEEIVPPTDEQVQKAENLLRQARLARTRGQNQEAARLLAEAQAAAPTAPVVLEAIGDDFVEQKQLKKAREAYKRAMDVSTALTGRVPAVLENKYAMAVMRSESASWSMPSTGGGVEAYASAKSSVVLSVLVPGLGQIVGGQIVKGAIILTLWLVCLVWLVLMGDHLRGVLGAMLGRRETFNAIVLLPLFAGVFLWIGAIIDASSRAKRYALRPDTERPKPPVDLPFE